MLTATRPRTREQIRAEAFAQIKAGPKGYFWRMLDAKGNEEQLAIAKSADEEIRALRATIPKLGGGVL